MVLGRAKLAPHRTMFLVFSARYTTSRSGLALQESICDVYVGGKVRVAKL